jgi:hypothetical protein
MRMAEIRLHVTQERLDELTVDDVITLTEASDGNVTVRELRDLVARFLVDANGAYLSDARARKALGTLKPSEFKMRLREFFGMVRALTINPTNANDSTPDNPSGG